MAASSMGQFGSHKIAWHLQRQGIEKYLPPLANDDTVWVTKRYVPTDLRAKAPVPRHKLIASDVKQLPMPEPFWIPSVERTNPWSFSREHEESGQSLVSQPSTRCEEWSTLRQMLPSRGSSLRQRPSNWGTGYIEPPDRTLNVQRSFPHINSPMTR